jgi:TonB family protein
MWKVLPLLALLCSPAHGQDNILAVTPASKSQPASKYKPSPPIVIEFAPVPVAPPPRNWKAERAAAESAANEWGRAAVERGRAAGSPAALPSSTVVPTWKSQIVARLEQHKQYPKEAASRREQGITQVFFNIDRQGQLLESRVVRPSGSSDLDEEALALLKRAEPYPRPPDELAGDHIDLTVPIRFNLTQSPTPQPASPPPSVKDGVTYFTHHKHVPSGKSRAIGSLMGAYPDCTPSGNAETEAAVIKAPEHGTVEIVPGQTFPNFTDPLRAKCNGKKMPTMLVNYKSAKGYVGPDEFVVFATFVHGVASEMTYKMNVR